MDNAIQPLLKGKNRKPIDVGSGNITASVGSLGLVRSINAVHNKHGFVTLTTANQFPDDKWYDSGFVREYRRNLAQFPGESYGIKPLGEIEEPDYSYIHQKYPLIRYQLGKLQVENVFVTGNEEGQSFLVQRCEVHNSSDMAIDFEFEFGGTFCVTRCSYGQLTEGGPLPIPPLENEWVAEGNTLTITNKNLQAKAQIEFYIDEMEFRFESFRKMAKEPIHFTQQGRITVQPSDTRTLHILYSLDEDSKSHKKISPFRLKEILSQTLDTAHKWKETIPGEDAVSKFVIERNIEFIVSCCAVPVSKEHLCIITDHQLLPLSWNRDSYYMVNLLFEAEKSAGTLLDQSSVSGWTEQIQRLIKGHLLWMFEFAQRPNGYWGRAYLANGYCKDNIFQLDQQCYPLLELCDYYNRFHDRETVSRILPTLDGIISMLMDYKDSEHWLFLTGETPADDKVDYPYHFSSQLLIWHTFNQLEKLNKDFRFYPEDLTVWADQVKRSCMDFFVTEHNGAPLFAYLTDLKGNYQKYHDANDLPTAYAPIWGFCSAEDERWLNTMKFAFSEQNKGGYYSGAFSGLGSVHTPHPWPLGDGQELLYSRLIGDRERFDKVWTKLQKLIQWDGLASEAVNEENGDVISRHWFSWPGAFISTVLLTAESSR